MKDYRGRAVTVHFNLAVCSHSAECLRRQPHVFDLDQRPWIDADAADIAAIAEAVAACPSGALSMTVKDDAPGAAPGADLPAIRVTRNGPYAVTGGIALKDTEFCAGAARDRYVLCRCGASKNKPFCDGAHRAARFRDQGA